MLITSIYILLRSPENPCSLKFALSFLGARAPLGPLDVEVKVKAKKFRNSMILLELLEDLQLCYRHLDIMVVINILQYYQVLPNIE